MGIYNFVKQTYNSFHQEEQNNNKTINDHCCLKCKIAELTHKYNLVHNIVIIDSEIINKIKNILTKEELIKFFNHYTKKINKINDIIKKIENLNKLLQSTNIQDEKILNILQNDLAENNLTNEIINYKEYIILCINFINNPGKNIQKKIKQHTEYILKEYEQQSYLIELRLNDIATYCFINPNYDDSSIYNNIPYTEINPNLNLKTQIQNNEDLKYYIDLIEENIKNINDIQEKQIEILTSLSYEARRTERC